MVVVIFKNLYEKLSAIHRNVYGVAFVGFFLQIGTSIIYGAGNAVIANVLVSTNTLMLIRNLSDSLPNLAKVLSGYLSDRLKNRVLFLYIGYGGIIFCKIIFWISLWKLVPILYIIAQMSERTINCIRDVPRDALIVDSTTPELRGISFGLRKAIASCGSIIGALFAYWIVQSKAITHVQLFAIPIAPTIIATILLFTMVKNIPQEKSDIHHNNTENQKYPTAHTNEKVIFSFIPSLIFSVASFTVTSGNYYITIGIFLSSILSLLYFTSSNCFAELKHYKQQLKPFIVILTVASLLILGRMNDTIFFSRAIELGMNKNTSILLFVLLYFFISSWSIFYSWLLKKSKFICIIIAILSALLTNFTLMYVKSYISIMGSLFFLGGLMGGIETVMSTLISLSIPSKNIRATIFGIFYSITGIIGVISSFASNLFINSKYGIPLAAKIWCIPSIISIIFFLFTKQIFSKIDK